MAKNDEKTTAVSLVNDIKTTNVEWKGFLAKTEGTLTLILDREEAKAKLNELVEKNKPRILSLSKKAVLDKAELEEVRLITKEHRDARLLIQTKVEKNNNDIFNKVKKRQTALNAELVEIVKGIEDIGDTILEAEKQRVAKAKQDAEDAIKKEIEEFDKYFKTAISEMTYETMAEVEADILETIEQKTGAFEEFDILFDIAAENAIALIESTKKTLTENYEAAEQLRKDKHGRKIEDISIAFKEVLFAAGFENIKTLEENVKALKKTDYDFEEFTDDFKAKVKELTELTTKRIAELKQAELDRIQKAKDDKELQDLRDEKLLNDRSKKLRAIGMVENADGDFEAHGEIYKVELIKLDSENIFNAMVVNITEAIAEATAPKEAPQIIEAPADVETVAPEPNEPVGAPETTQEPSAEETDAGNDDDAEQTTETVDTDKDPREREIATCYTVADIKKAFDGLDDDIFLFDSPVKISSYTDPLKTKFIKINY